MSTHFEWLSTTHPSFSVTVELAQDLDLEDEFTPDEEVLVIRGDEAAVIQGDLEDFARQVADAVYLERGEQQGSDAEYLATVISQGQLIGADWLTIAQRLIAVDLPGMGYWKG